MDLDFWMIIAEEVGEVVPFKEGDMVFGSGAWCTKVLRKWIRKQVTDALSTEPKGYMKEDAW